MSELIAYECVAFEAQSCGWVELEEWVLERQRRGYYPIAFKREGEKNFKIYFQYTLRRSPGRAGKNLLSGKKKPLMSLEMLNNVRVAPWVVFYTQRTATHHKQTLTRGDIVATCRPGDTMASYYSIGDAVVFASRDDSVPYGEGVVVGIKRSTFEAIGITDRALLNKSTGIPQETDDQIKARIEEVYGCTFPDYKPVSIIYFKVLKIYHDGENE